MLRLHCLLGLHTGQPNLINSVLHCDQLVVSTCVLTCYAESRVLLCVLCKELLLPAHVDHGVMRQHTTSTTVLHSKLPADKAGVQIVRL